jgi:hypothetical protein
MRIEHPLYKHLEYPTSETTMGSKDTVVGSADFNDSFFRLRRTSRKSESMKRFAPKQLTPFQQSN